MADTTMVWVKTAVLDLAIHGASRKHAMRNLAEADREDSEDVDWGWALANLLHVDDSSLKVFIRDEESAHNGVTVKLPSQSLKDGSVVMANKYGDGDTDEYEEEDPDAYPDDLITLTHLHEPAVVYCLRKRYALDKIYTATGPILLALNPFKNCKALYSERNMKEYWLRGEQLMMNGSVNDQEMLPPHVYGIADSSFRTMMRHMNDDGASAAEKRRAPGKAVRNTCDQSILVSGESGAGKTVTTKFIMQYLAKLSQRSHAEQDAKATVKDTETVEQQVLQSNPILESFGNARTIRNDNSSRFGKFIEIKFSNTGTLMGASIETYLLEKVRLVTQAEGERNYHIFYELFCMEDADIEEFYLQNYTIENFNMTNMSGTYDRRDGIEDYDTYEELRLAMKTMGMSDEKQRNVLSVPCATLHGSNVSFVAKSADESALDLENEHLEPFLELMGITPEALDKALCYLNIKAGKEFHTRTLSKAKAEKGMEALIKATYGALFTFLVKRINSSIAMKDGSSGGKSRRASSRSIVSAATIGVLDIFGFESFKVNSFEQLCINYCNEALQQQFNLFVLKNEQEEYDHEGIEWSFISFPDNQDVLDLIGKKGTGILKILDDQCRAPGTTDKTFYGDLHKKCIRHARFAANKLQVGALKFSVNHYAGPVEYDTEGFVEKNRDELPKETKDLLLSSQKEIIRMLAHIISDSSGTSVSSPDGARKKLSSSPRGGSAGTRVTVGGQFSMQLQQLRHKIDLTSPHYIRCLKPNDNLVPEHFDPLVVGDQLRYAGVIEAVRVSRVGYPQRYAHKAFVARYRVLGGQAMKKAARATKKKKPVDVLVNAIAPKVLDIQREEDAVLGNKGEEEEGASDDEPISLVSVGIQVGKTKVFLRRRAYEALEHLRRGKMGESVVKIQTIARGYIDRRDYRETRSSVKLAQNIVRMKIAVRRVQEARCHYRATVIQTAWRKGEAHRHFAVTIFIARWLQRMQRGRKGRLRYENLNRQRKAIVIQKYWRVFYMSKLYHAQRDAALTLQCAVRCMCARSEFKQLRLRARDLDTATQERDELRRETQILRQQLKEATALLDAEALHASELELSEVKKRVKELTQDVDRYKGELEDSRQLAKKERERAEAAVAARNDALSVAVDCNVETEVLKKQLQCVEREHDEARSADGEKDKEILSSEVKGAEEAMEERVASQGEHEDLQRKFDEAMKELESTSEKAAETSTNMEILERENEELRVELETAKKAVPKEVASDELELARKEIEALKEQLVDVASTRATPSSEEVEELKQKFGQAEFQAPWKERSDDATSVTALETVNEAAAEEILTLQDEVARLNRELKEARAAISNPNSPEMIPQGCDELEEAGLEKDGMIEDFNRGSVQYAEEQIRRREVKDRSEVAKLQQEIVNLRSQLDSHKKSGLKESHGTNKSNGGFFGALFGTGEGPSEEETNEQSENDLQAQVNSLNQVNEMLRQEVEKSRKEVNEVKFDLREEKERSAMELEAFAESLRGVDELRSAAEAMSRELSRTRREQQIQGLYRSEGDDGTAALDEANMILASARAEFPNQSEQENKPQQFWSVDHLISNVRGTTSNKTRDEYDIDPPYLKHRTDKKRRKKKRRGSGNSAVSSFF